MTSFFGCLLKERRGPPPCTENLATPVEAFAVRWGSSRGCGSSMKTHPLAWHLPRRRVPIAAELLERRLKTIFTVVAIGQSCMGAMAHVASVSCSFPDQRCYLGRMRNHQGM